MKPQEQLTIALGCSLIFLCSCSSVGTKFSHQPEVLVLGQLKSSEYVQYFGKPTEAHAKMNADGQYELAEYDYHMNQLGTVCSRILMLEFKRGVLNGFEFSSSFDEDVTKVNLPGVDQIRAGVGKLSQNDVAAVLGQPSGKAFCPTLLPDYKDRCAKGSEIWAWLSVGKIKVGFAGRAEAELKEMYVIFDSDGKVIDVQTEENKKYITHN
jgi:hypothetical protein